MKQASILIALLLAPACAGFRSNPRHEVRSLTGAELPPMELAPEREQELADDLASALAQHEEAVIWHGRRLAYLGRYGEAVETFSHGIEVFPRSTRLRRHRGHRYITLRRFDDAIDDLAWAARALRGQPDAVEPDGAPNAHGIPRSTDQSNVWYHLALAHWLKGDFQRAAWAWGEGLAPSRANDDMLVATSYWLFLARMRSGQDAAAREVLDTIHADMEILENHAYYRLLRHFQGKLEEEAVLQEVESGGLDSATTLYGLGIWRYLEGDEAGALELWRRIVPFEDSEDWPGFWPAFGYISAEAELARLGDRER